MERKDLGIVVAFFSSLFFIVMSIKDGIPIIMSLHLAAMIVGTAYIMRGISNIFEVIKQIILWNIACMAVFIIILSIQFHPWM